MHYEIPSPWAPAFARLPPADSTKISSSGWPRSSRRRAPQGKSLEPLTEYRLALISNATVDFIVPALTATAARYGIALECVAAGYDQGSTGKSESRLGDQSLQAARSAHCARLARCAVATGSGQSRSGSRLRERRAGAHPVDSQWHSAEQRRNLHRAKSRCSSRAADGLARPRTSGSATQPDRLRQSRTGRGHPRHRRRLAGRCRAGRNRWLGELVFALRMEHGEASLLAELTWPSTPTMSAASSQRFAARAVAAWCWISTTRCGEA